WPAYPKSRRRTPCSRNRRRRARRSNRPSRSRGPALRRSCPSSPIRTCRVDRPPKRLRRRS
ncbi:MAG: hypothetical protein AVDCRST_MAG91-926, partial [uncultured Sphingomonadaceae bacterium]